MTIANKRLLLLATTWLLIVRRSLPLNTIRNFALLNVPQISSRPVVNPATIIIVANRLRSRRSSDAVAFASRVAVAPLGLSSENNNNDNNENNNMINANKKDFLFVPVEGNDELPEGLLEEIQSSRPSEWMVMKELLGINIFTYVLVAAIAFFFSMNLLLGPGWLGSGIGIQGTGTSAFDNSNSNKNGGVQKVIDLSDSEYQL